MLFYSRVSFLLAFLVGAVIFFWSAVPGMPAPEVSPISLSTLYHFGMFALFTSFLLLIIWFDFKTGKIFLVLLLVLVYAGLDELHQFIVPGRSCDILDFGVDALGVLGSLMFISFCRLFRKN